MSAEYRDSEAIPRRRLLSTLVLVGTTGCTFGDTSPSGSTRTSDSTPAGKESTGQSSGEPSSTPADGSPETYRPTGSERTELRGSPFTELRVDTLPDAAPFGAGVEFLAQPAGEEPGRLAVELRNDTDSSLGVEGGVPDGSSESETGIAVSNGWADRASDDCPRGYRQADDVIEALWFDPNETIQETYDIHVTHDEPVCFPEGAHRIESEYRVYSSEASFNNNDDPMSRFYWGFVLTVERS